MSLNSLNIQPHTVVSSKTASTIQITVRELILGSKCVFRVLMRASNGSIVDVKEVVMQGADYAAWGNDDTYCVNFVMNRLGLSAPTA